MPPPAAALPSLFDSEPRPAAVEAAVREMATAGQEARGAVYTKRAVVDFVLDLAGYLPDRDLTVARLLEPSCGGGEFVVAAADRLLPSYFARGGAAEQAVADLGGAIRAVEVHAASLDGARRAVRSCLVEHGLPVPDAEALAEAWTVQDDFLLAPLDGTFTHVVGNPPYVRQERVAGPLLAEYRRRYSTVYDRADLYVPFIERGLRLLGSGGRLAFICADRWMKNRYGGPLRALVASGYRLEAYVDMTGVDAFEAEVSAYPAVFAIVREGGGAEGVTAVATRPVLNGGQLRELARTMRAPAAPCGVGQGRGADWGGDGLAEPAAPPTLAARPAADVRRVCGVVRGPEPWLLDAADEVAVLRRLERAFPTLEGAGCRVGIGVATGADRVFIRPMDTLDVEPERRLPLAVASDVRGGAVAWSGVGLLNPYEPDGRLADLDAYPRFAAYVRSHEVALRRRHTARKSPDRWYKTIDRVWPGLTARPKLLLPDIKGSATVAYDEGRYYPHHNLYYVVVDEETPAGEGWDLLALQAVLRSRVAEFFVAMYSVRMRGGYLRFQAQYVRRIRLPHWSDVDGDLRGRLAAAAGAERGVCDAVAAELYGLTAAEVALVTDATA